MKKALSILLSLLMLFSAFSVMPFSAFADTYKGIELDENKFYFDTSTTGWTLGTKDKIAFYITSDKYGEAMPYGAKKLCGTLCESGSEEGVWEYDPAAKGITIEDGVQYTIQFYNTGDSELTYPLYFDSNCLGHVAVCDGTKYENPTDSSESMLAAFWNDLDSSVYGPMLAITSSGSVAGTCLKDNETKLDMFENFISVAGDTGATGLENARVYVVEPKTKTEQQLIDDLGTALGLIKQDVYDAFNENSVETTWDYTISTLPGDVEIALKCGDNVYYSFSDDGNTVNIFGTGDTWDFTYDIYADPDCNSPFFENEDIKNIIVESGVTGLGNHLFDCCINVESISLPEGLTKIGEDALNFFYKIESVTLPSSVRYIGTGAFSNWQKLKSITIPDGVTSIESGTFFQCYDLESVVIPKSVTSVGDKAFSYCGSLTDVYYAGSEADRSNMTISSSENNYFTNATWHYNCRSGKCGDNVSYLFDGETLTLSGTGDTWDYTVDEHSDPICDSPFYENRDIKTINVESGITGLGDYLFYFCFNVENISLPDGLSYIGYGATTFFSKIENITIPSSVTSIGAGAFSNWQKLKSITIPDGVTSIESGTFFQCYDLESVVIPKSVTSVGDSAFSDCASLTDVYYYGSEADRSNITISSTDNKRLTDATWHYNCRSGKCGDNVYYSFDGETLTLSGTGDMYSWDNADNKSPFNGDEDICNVIIGDGVTGIGDYAFTGCTNLFSAAIPESVNAIGEGAFASSCVDEIVIPDGVETLEENVFSGCTNLNQLYIPSSVTAIKKGAFKDAPLSKEVFLGASGDDWSAVTTDETDNETLLNAEKYFGIPGAFDGFKAADIEAVNYQENEIKEIFVLIENNHIDEKITLTVFNDKGETVCSKEVTVTRYMSNRYLSIAAWTPPYLKSGEYTVFAYGILDGYKDNTEKDGKQYLYYDTESFEVTPKPKFSISNYDELKEFATLVNGGNNTLDAVLTADIVADDADWTPIGTIATRYMGTFDGGGHTITGLSNEDVPDKPDYAGLFGCVDEGGVIENVGLLGGSINGKSYVGGIVGYNKGQIKNCYNTGKVNGKADTGGIAGYNSNNIQDCYNTGAVYGNGSSIGGIVGEMKSGTVKNCYSSGNIISSYGFVGGVIGRFMGGTVFNCYNTGSVTGINDYVGGVAGNCKGTLENCYNTGTVKGGSNEVGGVIGAVIDNAKIINCYNKGEVDCTYSKAGGITGYAQNCIISNCFNTGNVKGGLYGVGGIAGTFGDAKVENCYNLGEVNGQDEVGGIAGHSFKYSGNCIINCCYSYGAVICNGEHFGALAGKNENGMITNCYYDKSLCVGVTAIGGSEDTINVKGLATVEMTGTKALDNMVFTYSEGEENPWLVKEDEDDYWYYPHLKGFNKKTDGTPETDSTQIPALDWPAKVEAAVTWNEPESYKYSGSEIKPTVTAITAGGKALDSSEYTVSCYKKLNDFWSTDTVNPTDAGDYKAVIKFTADGHANIEKAFAITKAPLSITVNGNSCEKVYNGSEQTFNGTFTATSTDTGFDASKFSYSGNTAASGTNKGEYTVNPASDKCSYSDNNYNVTWTMGNPVKLTITPKSVTITAKSEDFTYDGTAHSCSLYDVDGLAGNDAVSAVVEGSITFPGESPVNNVVKSYEFTSGTAGNYTVTKKNGTLTMRKASAPITIASASQNWTYDGKAHSNNTVTVTSGSLFNGDTLTATAAGSVTNVSDTANGNNMIAAGYKVMHGTADVTENYVITPVNGTLTIKPAAITITADDKESNHGLDLLALTYKIGGNYVDGDDLGITLNADIDNTKPGAYTITPSWNNNSNYTATIVDGTYTVGDDPHYYGTQGDERFTCTVCGAVDDTLKAEAEAADKNAADTAAANAVTDKINALPEADKVTTADEKAITEAREAYDSLTDDRKAKVTPETVNKLKDAEKALADAKEAEAKAAEEKANAEFAKSVTVTSDKNGATVGWKKANEAKRYVIYAAYCGKKSKYKKIKTVKCNITSFKLKKLNGKKINTKKNLKVYIVAQKKVNGKWVKLFKTPTFHIAGKKSKNTNVKKITVKKAKYTLKTSKTAKIKAKLVLVDKKKKPINHVRKFRYMSTNTSVVKVTKKGKIKAVGKGTATIYVFSNNGTPKAIKVTVK